MGGTILSHATAHGARASATKRLELYAKTVSVFSLLLLALGNLETNLAVERTTANP